ncbi:PDK [Symbiodinium sp. CCMP2592]|nr:PDK [Symbiodinium sp. CCMP2592]
MSLASAVACGTHQLQTRQQDSLQAIVNKHVQDPALRELNSSQTSTERGVQRWEQAHLVSALDVINDYQRSRRARVFKALGDFGPSWRRSYKNDPRTRMCELLKSWLRANAASSSLAEEEVRSMCGLCRDILSHPHLFPARNPQSFLKSIADVYDHLQWQLQEVLEKDRSCAELAQRLISLSRNLVADTVSYLLLAPTDLKDTDGLPSLEVVKLWQSLPDAGHPMPNRKDPGLQKLMSEAWSTRCGALVAALLRAPWCIRLFAGADAENTARLAALENGDAEVAETPIASLQVLLRQARVAFQTGNYKASGLVGALRGEENSQRENLLHAITLISDIMYLLGEVMVQFHRISDGLGDYGMIRVAPWLHPILDSLQEKVQQLKASLEQLSNSLDAAYVLARARGQKIQKPAPSEKMCARARDAIQRALLGGTSHASQLLWLAEELRARSAPERLPHLAKGLGDACLTLSEVLVSAEFRRHVGDSFPQLPTLTDLGSDPKTRTIKTGMATLALEDLGGMQTRFSERRPVRVRTEPKTAHIMKVTPWTDGDVQDTASTSATPRTMARENSQSCSSCCSAQTVGIPTSGPVLTFEVNRLTSFEPLKRHDRRRIEIQHDELLIYSTGSQSRIKSAVQLPEGVERVFLLSDTVLEACFSLVPADAVPGGGVVRPKDYIFEFATPEQADIFCEELWHRGVR